MWATPWHSPKGTRHRRGPCQERFGPFNRGFGKRPKGTRGANNGEVRHPWANDEPSRRRSRVKAQVHLGLRRGFWGEAPRRKRHNLQVRKLLSIHLGPRTSSDCTTKSRRGWTRQHKKESSPSWSLLRAERGGVGAGQDVVRTHLGRNRGGAILGWEVCGDGVQRQHGSSVALGHGRDCQCAAGALLESERGDSRTGGSR